jgi:hypothetical protein
MSQVLALIRLKLHVHVNSQSAWSTFSQELLRIRLYALSDSQYLGVIRIGISSYSQSKLNFICMIILHLEQMNAVNLLNPYHTAVMTATVYESFLMHSRLKIIQGAYYNSRSLDWSQGPRTAKELCSYQLRLAENSKIWLAQSSTDASLIALIGMDYFYSHD